ncbi:hypothetical protein [Aliagarivorans taiwanensis]|uniref:hypothetical protein n=1 Tax=Aliagarivorans taiwanensis TaxID=561966 RepID=UPI000402AB2B|nr:hypothetical protein [Aliagarivorans taiwanensis]
MTRSITAVTTGVLLLCCSVAAYAWFSKSNNFTEPQICRATIATASYVRQLGEVTAVNADQGLYQIDNQGASRQVTCSISELSVYLDQQSSWQYRVERGQLQIIEVKPNLPLRVRQFNEAQLTHPKVSLSQHNLPNAFLEMFGEGYDTDQLVQHSVALLKANHICGELDELQLLEESEQSDADFRAQARLLQPYVLHIVQTSDIPTEMSMEVRQQINRFAQDYHENTPRILEWLSQSESAMPLDQRLLAFHLGDLAKENRQLRLPNTCQEVVLQSKELGQTL